MAPLHFFLNGKRVDIRDISPNETLLNYLRYEASLTGTKEGCAEGDCGACTVLMLDAEQGRAAQLRAVNSCLVLVPMLHGREVFTVEALRDKELHPVQQAMVDTLGSQCGFCTPGVVMSMTEAAYRSDLDSAWKVDDQMCGNLCRCTGYRPIREAATRVAGTRPPGKLLNCLDNAKSCDRGLNYEALGESFIIPTSFTELFQALENQPDARIVAGATDLSLEITKAHRELPHLVSVESIPELHQLELREEGVYIGAAVPLTDVETALLERMPMVSRMLRYYGARQIKHRATAGGNICNASPIGDLPPVLLALDAKLHLRSKAGARTVSIDEFFLGYRQTALKPGEVLEAIWIPNVLSASKSGAYKVSRRRELDISAVAAGIVVQLGEGSVVTAARIGVGGVAATPIRAKQTEDFLVGKVWNEDTAEEAAQIIEQEFSPLSDHRSSEWYRRKVIGNLIRGFYQETLDADFVSLPDAPTATVVLEASHEQA
ncbi:MAG: xanthine dehydrogenase small subunit [Deltaproteobacteria bacterium]|jgi:xanthine dehydrogenase small subunit|nr:xanthine dehydrogenase small subunit [Deltaproteobacteria bacterium]